MTTEDYTAVTGSAEHIERPETPDLAQSFVGDMPMAKLDMVGALSEQELAEMIEVVNREHR